MKEHLSIERQLRNQRMNSDPVLLPKQFALYCPFCGHLPQMEYWHGGGPMRRMVSCSNELCPASPHVLGTTPKAALTLWNIRKREP